MCAIRTLPTLALPRSGVKGSTALVLTSQPGFTKLPRLDIYLLSTLLIDRNSHIPADEQLDRITIFGDALAFTD